MIKLKVQQIKDEGHKVNSLLTMKASQIGVGWPHHLQIEFVGNVMRDSLKVIRSHTMTTELVLPA